MSGQFTTPGGVVYDSCAVLDRTITYTNGYDWNPYITSVRYYLKRGLGYVAAERRWSDGSTDRHYVTSYTMP